MRRSKPAGGASAANRSQKIMPKKKKKSPVDTELFSDLEKPCSLECWSGELMDRVWVTG